MLRQGPRRRRATRSLDVSAGSKIAIHRLVRSLCATLLFSLVFTGSAQAASSDGVFDHLSAYRKAAEAGNSKAQYLLGLRYERGVSGSPDFAAAVRWYAKAAAQGMRLASFRLGLIYQYGRGIERDYARAAKWYASAAEAGLAEAQYNLGYLYERGLGLTVDGFRAAVWYRRAALQGITQAYRSLGMLYAMGQVVERDDGRALFWLSLAKDDPQLRRIMQVVEERGGVAARNAAQKMRDEWNAQR